MDDYENDDVEMVFESMRAAREQRDRQTHDELLTSFWRDGLRIGELDTFDPKQWDPSLVAAEVRGTWPKEVTP